MAMRKLILSGLSVLLLLILGASIAGADTQNNNPWVAGAPIPPDPAGGSFSGYVEGGCAAKIGGKIYHAFGYDAASGDSRGFRIYSPTTDSWTLGPTPPALFGRSEF